MNGATDYQIDDAIKATWPDVDARPLIAGAVAEIAKQGDLDRELVRGWCFCAARDLYRRMVEIGDFTCAL